MISKMMEITTKIGCSLNCRFCPQQLLIDSYIRSGDCQRRDDMMKVDTFRTCIDKIPADIDIHFSGMCEPWLNPECTVMLKYAYEKGHRIHIFTTLAGMKKDDYETIRGMDIDTFVLHIPDREGNSGFVIDSQYLDLFGQVIRDASSGRFRIDRFSCHGSVHPAIAEQIAGTGIDMISTMYDRAGNVNEECDIKVEQPLQGSIVCRWCGGTALDKNVLLPDGTVLICCMDYGMKYPLGNLLDSGFSEISEGKMKVHYRHLMLSEECGDILCRKCYRAGLADGSAQDRR